MVTYVNNMSGSGSATPNTGVSASDTGGSGNTVFYSANSVEWTDTTTRTGTGMAFKHSGAYSYAAWNNAGATYDVISARGYFFIPSTSTISTDFGLMGFNVNSGGSGANFVTWGVRNVSGVPKLAVWEDNTVPGGATPATIGNTIPFDTWFRIEATASNGGSGTNWDIYTGWALGDGPFEQEWYVASSSTGARVVYPTIGNFTDRVAPVFYSDDFIWVHNTSGSAAYPGPASGETLGKITAYTGDFEGGTTDGWTTPDSALLASSTTYAHGGSRSLRVYKNTNFVDFTAEKTISGLVPGTTYNYGAWVYRNTSTGANDVRLGIDGTTFSAPSTPPAATWTYRTLAFKATSTSHTISVVANSSSGAAAIYALYIDDVTVTAWGPVGGGGTTPVDATPLSSTWDVRSTVSDSETTTWNVLTTVSDTQTTEWDVRSAISDSQATTYDVRALVSDSQSTEWDVFAFTKVEDSISTDWNVLSKVSDTQSTDWTVSEKVSDSETTSWTVLSGLSVSGPSTSYAVRSKVAQDAPAASWTVYSVISDAQATSWDVRSTVTDSQDTIWDIRTVVSDSESTQWNVLTSVSDSQATTWDISTTVSTKSITSNWNVATPAVTYKNTAEGGTHGAAVTTGNSGTSGDAFSMVTGTVYYTTNVAGANGSTLSFESQSAAGVQSIGWQDLNGGTSAALRSYVYLTSYPTSTNYIHRLGNGSAAQGWSGITPGGILISRFEGSGSTTTGSVQIPLNTWVRIETLTDTAAGTTTSAWYTGGSLTIQDVVSDTDTPTNANITQGTFGKLLSSANNPVNFDDLAFRTNATVFIGPEGGVVTSTPQTTSWNVSAKVEDNQPTEWGVRVVLPAVTKATDWTVYGKVSDSESTEWGIRSKVSDSETTTWNIFVPIAAPKTISSAWNVAGSVSDSQGTSWDVKAKMVDTMPTEWDVRSKLVDTQSTEWGVRVKSSVSMAWDTWNVSGAMAPATVYTDWDVRELVSDEITTLWRIGGALRVFRAQGNLGGAQGAASSGGNTGNGTMEGQILTSAVLSDSAMEAALGGTSASRTLNPYEFTE